MRSSLLREIQLNNENDKLLLKKCMIVENCFKELDHILNLFFAEVHKRLTQAVSGTVRPVPLTMAEIQSIIDETISLRELFLSIKHLTLNTVGNIDMQLSDTALRSMITASLRQLQYVIDENKFSCRLTETAQKICSETVSLGLTALGVSQAAKTVIKFHNADQHLTIFLQLTAEEERKRTNSIISKRLAGMLENLKHRLYSELTSEIADIVYGESHLDFIGGQPVKQYNVS